MLGAPNDEFGALSPISAGRIRAAASLYRADRDLKVIATGGRGPHFNQAPQAHRTYANAELMRLGVPRAALTFEGFLTSNTVEDVIEIAAYAAERALEDWSVLTSAFHLPRCRLVFDCVAPDRLVAFHAARDPPTLATSILAHEAAAQDAIRARGGVTYGARFFALPPAAVGTGT